MYVRYSAVIWSLLVLWQSSAAEDPVVTLCHGGKLRGSRVSVGDKQVLRFLGLRYAKPPIGELRLRKPQRAEAWQGTLDATKSGNRCVQVHFSSYVGSEDCLFMDLYIPGNTITTTNTRKAVMVFIHGGGYILGESPGYIGAPLAAKGDVIVVTLNYRLGMLGFLYDGPDTEGNFALWDQRAALVWVKENIELFGGDPDRITIFGESAGAGSVAAQMMGRYNDGLFKRGIAQSGSLYSIWGWYNSPDLMEDQKTALRNAGNCTNQESLYDCLRKASLDTLLAALKPPFPLMNNVWHPRPDNDFFPEGVEAETYDLIKRFDLMAGYNGMEGAVFVIGDLDVFLATRNESYDNGMTLESTAAYLTARCQQVITKQAPELCSHYIITAYNLTNCTPRERLIRLVNAWSDLYLVADAYHLLSKHSEACRRSTYGYYFTFNPGPYMTLAATFPKWAQLSATHGDELSVLFGTGNFTEDMIGPIRDSITANFTDLLLMYDSQFNSSYYQVSSTMMTLWTNFAKSGSPNYPESSGAPYWTGFEATGQVMNIDKRFKMIDVPEKTRVQGMKSTLFPALRRLSGYD